MISRGESHIKGIALAILGFSLFACGDAIIKHTNTLYSVYTIVLFNEIFVISYFLLLSRPLGGLKQAFQSPHLKWHLLRGVLVVLQVATIVYGFGHMSMAKTYALIFSAPFFTTLLARLTLKEKVSGKNWLAIALGFSGVLIILRPGMIPLDLPSLAVLVSALCFAGYNLMARQFGKNESLLGLGLLPRLAFVFVIPLYLLNPEIPEISHLPYFAVMGVFGACGFLAVTLGFIYAPAGLVAPFHYIQMLWGILFGYLLFKDPLDLPTTIGAILIIASGLWLIRQRRGYKEAAPPV